MSNKPYTILVVDDEKSIRESFADYFEDLNYKVLMAESGEDAMSLVQQYAPEGAVIDIRLPGMDGNELIKKLNELHPGIICVICTGSPEYSIPGNVDLPCGVKHVFTKPLTDLAGMEKALRELIEQKLIGGESNA